MEVSGLSLMATVSIVTWHLGHFNNGIFFHGVLGLSFWSVNSKSSPSQTSGQDRNYSVLPGKRGKVPSLCTVQLLA